MEAETQQISGSMSDDEVMALDPLYFTRNIGDPIQAKCPAGHKFITWLQSFTINVCTCPVCGADCVFEYMREATVYFADADPYWPDGGPAVIIHFERLPATTMVRVHGPDEAWYIPASELIELVARARPNTRPEVSDG